MIRAKGAQAMVKAQNIHCTIVQENALQSRYARGREAERQRGTEVERRKGREEQRWRGREADTLYKLNGFIRFDLFFVPTQHSALTLMFPPL